MQYNVQVEKTSNIQRKLTIQVPAQEVTTRLQRGLAEVQKTAKLKGFRPGQAPLSIIQQYYGEDVRHRVFHNLIDESFEVAVREQNIRTVGQPTIETPNHKTGEGAHDHSLHEDQDLTFIATVEVLPEIEVKGYAGVALTQGKVEVTDEQVDQVVKGLLDSRSELLPASGGLTLADGTQSSPPVKKGHYVDLEFNGGLVTDQGIEERPGMKGNRMLEVGSDSLIPGFEDNLVGMHRGETKTFRVPFPKDYYEAEFAGKESEFTVTINEVKDKKLPELTDEFAKELGYESVADIRAKAREHLNREKTDEVDRKLRGDLVQALIEKNPFDVPKALVQSQVRALAQDLGENLRRQGFNDAMIQEAVAGELEQLKVRAESQVRASLILEAVAKKEQIEAKEDEMNSEIAKMAVSMKVEEQKVRDFYAKDPGRREDLAFRLRQESTLKFLLDKAKIKKDK